MTIDQIRTFYEAQPFRPFEIHLADGRSIVVRSREFMASAPSGRTVIVYQPDDTWNVIDLLLATDLEAMPIGNGGRKRKR